MAENSGSLITSRFVERFTIASMSNAPPRTDMGGPGASRSPAQAAKDMLWLATLPDNGPTGGFFRGRRRVAW